MKKCGGPCAHLMSVSRTSSSGAPAPAACAAQGLVSSSAIGWQQTRARAPLHCRPSGPSSRPSQASRGCWSPWPLCRMQRHPCSSAANQPLAPRARRARRAPPPEASFSATARRLRSSAAAVCTSRCSARRRGLWARVAGCTSSLRARCNLEGTSAPSDRCVG
jgi:hypothetical protein